MDSTYLRNSTANSLVTLPFFFTIMLGQSNHQESLIDKKHNVQRDFREVFRQLPNQNITFEQSQMDILVSFVSKLANESEDLDGEIVDMVNKHFWDLI